MPTTPTQHDRALVAAPNDNDRRADQLRRLHMIEGQVCGIARMVEHDRPCVDVQTQIIAVTRALKQVASGLLEDHLRRRVLEAARATPAERQASLEELASALRQAVRL